MSSEARKLHLIEELLKLDDLNTLGIIESVLFNYKKNEPKTIDFTRFVGKISEEDLDAMERAIKEGCVNIDEYKKPQEGAKSFKDFAGLMTDEEADEFMKVINDGCGQIDEDGW